MRTQQAGFTLVEVTITLVIASLVIGVLMNFATDSIVNYTVAQARSDIIGQTQGALDIMTNDIRLSASADENNRWADEYAPGIPADEFSWASGSDTLVLAAAAEDEDGEILFADPAHYISHKNNIIYFLQDGTLYKRVLAAPELGNSATTSCPQTQASASCPADRRLLDDVVSFEIRYYDAGNNQVTSDEARSVEVEVGVLTRRYGRDVTVNRSVRTVFRND